MDDIETYFLCAGCQSAKDVANKLAEFVGRATKTIDMALYTFHLSGEAHDILATALKGRADAGVAIRIAYDAGTQQAAINYVGHKGGSTRDFVESLGYSSRAIEGYHALMHDKYVVVDARTPNGQVWTGSLNFSDDAWTLQESNVITLHSQVLSEYYAHDFEELWADGNIASTGIMDSGEATLHYGGDSAFVLVNFAPGEGEWIDESMGRLIDRTTEKATIAAVVITSTRIISALQGLMQRNVPIEGIYDWTQMEGVKYQWSQVPQNNWKIKAFEEIVAYGHLIGKKSTPYTDTSKHDFMHNKVMVLDNVVVTGSYNFSRHAQANAENILMITSNPLTQTYRQYIASIMSKYSAQPPTQGLAEKVAELTAVTEE